jgi:nucleotide-binding universal stress UspA family protein
VLKANNLKTVVVGVKSWSTADPVLEWAAALAATAGARLHVVHAYSETDPLGDVYYHLGRPEFDIDAHFRDFVRDRLISLVASAGLSDEIVCHAAEGPASSVLGNLASDVGADLIVVGASRRGRIARSLAERAARQSPVPVLVLRGPPVAERPLVLVATDLSPLSAHLSGSAARLVQALWPAATLPAVHTLLVVETHGLATYYLDGEAACAVALHELSRFLREQADPVVRAAVPRVRYGTATTEIVREAEELGADLVVVGTHGRRGLARLVLGSVAAQVIEDCPTSVLAVPPDASAVANPGSRSAAPAVVEPGRSP